MFYHLSMLKYTLLFNSSVGENVPFSPQEVYQLVEEKDQCV